MASEMEEVASVMGEMRTNPVEDMGEEFLEKDLLRLDNLKVDVRLSEPASSS